MSAAVHPTCLATFVGYTCKHTVTVTICTESLIFYYFFFAGIAWQQNDISASGGWGWVGWMDG